MSTTAAIFPAIMANVPVDRFEIVNGPGMAKCWEARELLLSNSGDPFPYRNLLFTLKTPASDRPFRRTLQIATITGVRDGGFAFTAIFCGEVVSGIYDTLHRTGWFNLD